VQVFLKLWSELEDEVKNSDPDVTEQMNELKTLLNITVPAFADGSSTLFLMPCCLLRCLCSVLEPE
jgi:hypothetical protein